MRLVLSCVFRVLCYLYFGEREVERKRTRKPADFHGPICPKSNAWCLRSTSYVLKLKVVPLACFMVFELFGSPQYKISTESSESVILS